MTLSRSEAKRITKTVLGAATLPEVDVRVSASHSANLRIANNQATTSGDVEEQNVTVTVSEGGRAATASGNRTDKTGLVALVQKAEELCRLSPVDPERMPPLGAQKYLKVNATDRKTAKLNAEGRANLAAKLIRVANLRKLVVAGMVQSRDSASAVASSAGLFGYHASTRVSITTTMRTKDGTGSGWAGSVSHRVADIDAEGVALKAADKGEMSQGPMPIEPGEYTVVLEAQAVADLLGFLFWSMATRAADEGRSYFSRKGGGTRVGEALFHPSVTLRSDPTDANHPSSPIGGRGVALSPTTWIEGGVLKRLATSRYWAKTKSIPFVPRATSTFMSGSNKSLLDLIRGVDRGVLVTRFWYNRMLSPRTILATGLTRDGTFLINGGKIAGPVKNLRYNESPVTLLKNVLAAGTPERVTGGRVTVVPPLVVHGFNFSSTSDAV